MTPLPPLVPLRVESLASRVRPQTDIRSVAVLGAGTMGAQLAAHAANAGVAVRLFDLDRETARAGLEEAARRQPDPFFIASAQRLVDFGGFETDCDRLADADWIVEAVIEQADAKRALLAMVDRHRTPGTPVSTNTSSLSVDALAEGRSEDFRRCWLGTHFFNPPRHLHLVELVSTPATDQAVGARVARFCDLRLGKGVVFAKDTPGFIANRIGLYDTLQALRVVESGRYSVEAIDRMSGPLVGRPPSATFRTLDIVGLDIAAAAISAIGARLPAGRERAAFSVPRLVQDLLDRGWIGDKSGRGFYALAERRNEAESGMRLNQPPLVLDARSLTYALRTLEPVDPRTLGVSPELSGPSAAEEDLRRRLRQLFLAQNDTGTYLRDTLGRTLVYAAEIAGAIAESLDDIDRAMRWGFGWALGPFEMWDAIGAAAIVDAMKQAAPPSLVEPLLAKPDGRIRAHAFRPLDDSLDIAGHAARAGRMRLAGHTGRVLDLGDGVLHAQLTPRRGDLLDVTRFLEHAVAEASASALALVIQLDGSSIDDRAVARDLLSDSHERRWDAIDLRLRAVQHLGRTVHDAEIPVIVCANGRLTGEACALALQAVRVQAGAELRLGLIDAGLGLVPATGGTTALIVRAARAAQGDRPDLVAAVRPVFDLLRSGTQSTSARHGRALGLLRPRDGITMNPDRLALDAKAVALVEASRLRDAPTRRRSMVVGGKSVSAALKLSVHLAWRAGRIGDHDALVARALATVVAGGAHAQPREVSEEDLFDLEREAFLGLCSEPKTLDRLEHFVATGQLLRN